MPTSLLIALPRVGIPDSLEGLSTFANQLQTVVGSAIAHPIWAITAVVFGIGLLQLIADLVKRIIKSTLTFVLTLPLTLSQWIWKRATTYAPAKPVTETAATKTGQVSQLIERLETLRTEQDEIIAELKGMLGSTEKVELPNPTTLDHESAEETQPI